MIMKLKVEARAQGGCRDSDIYISRKVAGSIPDEIIRFLN
jgi:hypothetical protein